MPGSELSERLLYHAVYWPSYFTLTFGFSFRAWGREHVPLTGPLLLVANHQSFIDPWIVGQAAPRRLKYLARHTLFENRLLGPIITRYGAMPIDRNLGKDGMLRTVAALNAGQAVVVFAEGERTHNGEVQPLKPGIALLIKKAACRVVPVGIAGGFAMWPRQQKWPNPAILGSAPTRRRLAVEFAPALAPEFTQLPREQLLTTLRASLIAVQARAETHVAAGVTT